MPAQLEYEDSRQRTVAAQGGTRGAPTLVPSLYKAAASQVRWGFARDPGVLQAAAMPRRDDLPVAGGRMM
jgi:hypothetical protein